LRTSKKGKDGNVDGTAEFTEKLRVGVVGTEKTHKLKNVINDKQTVKTAVAVMAMDM